MGLWRSGPAQLALALLADWSGDDGFALKHYQILNSNSSLACRVANGS